MNEKKSKNIAQKIYDLRSKHSSLCSAEREEIEKLRKITDKVDGVCKFEMVTSHCTDWKAIAETLFLQYELGDAEKNALIEANTKEASYEILTFEKDAENGELPF